MRRNLYFCLMRMPVPPPLKLFGRSERMKLYFSKCIFWLLSLVSQSSKTSGSCVAMNISSSCLFCLLISEFTFSWIIFILFIK